MALTSIDVTWTKSVVIVGGLTKYRLQTACSNPVNITDAALLVFSVNPNQYLQVAAVGDMLAYWPYFPAVRRLNFAEATLLSNDYIGNTVTGQTSGHTGILRGISSDTKIWIVSPTTSSDVFQAGENVTVDGTPPVTKKTSTIVGDTRYRSATATQDFNTPQEALADETAQKTSFQNLITDWANDYGSYEGTDSETIKSS